MPERIDVFLSSTSRDLKKFREKLKDVVLNAGAFPIAMEEFDASERNALQTCFAEVSKAEIFIGVYAYRYGFAPSADMHFTDAAGTVRAGDGQTSITEWEYRWARERGLPMLLYVVADEDDEGEPLAWPPAFIDGEPASSRLKAFKDTLKARHVVGFFRSADDLARQVAGALPKLLDGFPSASILVAPVRRDFFRHINLPANYIPRPDLLAALRGALLAEADGIALHGLGGIGKSVMARALCDDEATQAAFPDGILWASIGQDATDDDLKSKLRAWVEALGGTISGSAPSLDSLKGTLATLLARRHCLLIIDDVWRRRDGEHFRVNGPNCRLLVTTRDAEVARALGVRVESVPLMSDAEADALLDQWAEGALRDALPSDRRRIYDHTLGRLPLAIRLAGAQLRGRSLDTWLAAFDARRLALRRPESAHDSLALTFGLSLDALPDLDRALYALLSIFREDEAIPETVIHRLWLTQAGLDANESAELIDDLGARALLEIEVSNSARAVVLHDLLRDFVRAELPEPASAHRALLNAYRAHVPGQGWHTIADDGYLYAHLGYHLVGAGDLDGLWSLFLDDGWMRARVIAEGYRYDGYIADLDLARRYVAEPRAEAQIADSASGFSAFALVVRCTLIRTTINSLASTHIRALIVRAVEMQLPGWSPARALSTARHMLRPTTRIGLYAGLLATGKLSPEDHASTEQTALADALAVYDPATRAEVLCRLLAATNGPLRDRLLAEALTAIEAVSAKESLIFAIGQLAPHLSEGQRAPLMRRALDLALSMPQQNPRAEAVRRLAPHLTPDQQGDALTMVAEMDNERFAVEVFEALAPRLHDTALAQAFTTAEGFQFPNFRCRARAALALRLPSDHPSRADLITGALADAEAPADWWIGAAALAAVSRLMAGEQRLAAIAHALDLIKTIDVARSRLRALTALAPALHSADADAIAFCLKEAAEADDVDQETLAELLAALAGKLTGSGLKQLLLVAARLDAVKWRSRVLSAHAAHFNAELLDDALKLNALIGDQRYQVETVAHLMSALPDAEREAAIVRAIAIMKSIADAKQRAKAAAALAGGLRGTRFEVVLEQLASQTDDHSRMKIITAAWRGLGDQAALDQLVTLARGLSDAAIRTEALITFWEHLSDDERRALVEGISKGADQRGLRAQARLLQAVDEPEGDRREELFGIALNNAKQISAALSRAAAVADVAQAWPTPESMAAVDDALARTASIGYQWSRASALAKLARVLSPAQSADVFAQVREFSDMWSRIWSVAALVRAGILDDPALLPFVRRDLFDYARGRRVQKRDAVLQFIGPRTVYGPPVISHDGVAEIARAIVDICWNWDWL